MVTYTVAASGDDVRMQGIPNDAGRAVGTGSGVTSITETTLSPGSHATNDEWSIGARFTGIVAAQGATISAATFSLKAKATYATGGTISYLVSAHAADNGGTFTASGGSLNVTNRPRTTAVSAAWNQASVTGGTRYTIDVTSVVQEIVNRAGWVSGNAIVIIVDTNSTTTLGEWQDYYAWDDATNRTTNPPQLDITTGSSTFTLSGGGTVPVPAGSGTGLTYTSNSALSGSGTISAPSGSGTGLGVTNPSYTLSGSGTVAAPAGSGTGLTFANAIYSLSGGATVPAPSGGGTGLAVTAPTYTLSGSGTLSAPSGSGAGLAVSNPGSTISGSGIVPTFSGSGFGLRAYSARTGGMIVSTATTLGVDGGFTDATPKQLVRTSNNRVYIVAPDGPSVGLTETNKLHVYRADQVGLPTSFSKLSLTEPQQVTSVAVAIDRHDVIHIAWRDRIGNGSIGYATLTTATDTLSATTTVDTNASAPSDNEGQGSEGVSLQLDSVGVPHLAYLYHDGTKYRAAYRNRTGGSWSARALVDNNTYGSNERAWHPALAVDGSDRILFGWAAGTFNEVQNNLAFSRVSTDGGATFGTRATIGAIWTSIDTGLVFYISTDGRYHVSMAESINTANVYSERVRYYYSDDQGATWTANHPEGGGAATHNPSVGPGAGGKVRIYGHGAQNTSDHGVDITYWESAGGAASWSTRQSFYVNATVDSSVNVRWAYHFHWFPNTLDVAFWDDTYPNDLYWGGEQVIPDAVLGQDGGATIPAPSGSGTGLQFANAIYALSGSATLPGLSGSGTGLTTTPPTYALSGAGVIGAPTGSGSGLAVTLPPYTLSGGATIPTVSGSGAGLSITAPTYALSGSGTVATPSGSGAGLQFANAIYSLSGTGTVPTVAGSGAGLTFVKPVYALSGTGSVPVPSGGGAGLVVTNPAYTLSGSATVPGLTGSGAGLRYSLTGFPTISNPRATWGGGKRGAWGGSDRKGTWG